MRNELVDELLSLLFFWRDNSEAHSVQIHGGTEYQLSIAITGLLMHPLLASWNHLSNRVPSPKCLYQALLWGKTKPKMLCKVFLTMPST